MICSRAAGDVYERFMFFLRNLYARSDGMEPDWERGTVRDVITLDSEDPSS